MAIDVHAHYWTNDHHDLLVDLATPTPARRAGTALPTGTRCASPADGQGSGSQSRFDPPPDRIGSRHRALGRRHTHRPPGNSAPRYPGFTSSRRLGPEGRLDRFPPPHRDSRAHHQRCSWPLRGRQRQDGRSGSIYPGSEPRPRPARRSSETNRADQPERSRGAIPTGGPVRATNFRLRVYSPALTKLGLVAPEFIRASS